MDYLRYCCFGIGLVLLVYGVFVFFRRKVNRNAVYVSALIEFASYFVLLIPCVYSDTPSSGVRGIESLLATLLVSITKYMGEGYSLYKKHYSLSQRQSMNRSNIVPDCLVFYLLSQYPLASYDSKSQTERDFHMGKMMWVVNRIMGYRFFKIKFIDDVEQYQRKHNFSIKELLEKDN